MLIFICLEKASGHEKLKGGAEMGMPVVIFTFLGGAADLSFGGGGGGGREGGGGKKNDPQGHGTIAIATCKNHYRLR